MLRRHLLAGLMATLPIATTSLRQALAQDSTDRASRFIDAQGRALVRVLESDSPNETKRREVAEILRKAVDVRGVGQFVLGRHWRTASASERDEYLELFEETLIRNLTARFGELRGLTFTVGRAQPRGSDVLVATTVDLPNQPGVALDWLVADVSGEPKIVDLVAEGTSLRITQRSEYSAVIQRGGGQIKALLDAMRRQLAALEQREVAANGPSR